jgi:hypothetical protein
MHPSRSTPRAPSLLLAAALLATTAMPGACEPADQAVGAPASRQHGTAGVSPAGGPVAPPVAPFHLVYRLEAFGLPVGEVSARLEETGDGRYVYRRETTATGLLELIRDDRIEETGVAVLDGGRYRPLSYRYRHTGPKKVREESVQFHWEKGVAVATRKDETRTLDIPDRAVGRMTLELALIQDARGPGPWTYPIVEHNKLKTYAFATAGHERVATGAGPLDTVKVTRTDVEPTRQSSFWLAPALGYLPVKVEHIDEEENDHVVMRLERIIPAPEP